jgi:hypothetical protein
MRVITAERLFMKFCIRGCLGSLLRQFRFYWDQIILTATWREILLTQHDVLLEGLLYVYVFSQFRLRPEKNYHVLAQTIHIALDCTGSTWLPFMAQGPLGSDMSWCLRWIREMAPFSWLDPKQGRQIKYSMSTFPGLFKNYSSEGVYRFLKSLGTTSKF